jgi:hypothetical protein
VGRRCAATIHAGNLTSLPPAGSTTPVDVPGSNPAATFSFSWGETVCITPDHLASGHGETTADTTFFEFSVVVRNIGFLPAFTPVNTTWRNRVFWDGAEFPLVEVETSEWVINATDSKTLRMVLPLGRPDDRTHVLEVQVCELSFGGHISA